MFTVCPNCRTRYQGPGYCPACGVQLVDEASYNAWMAQQQALQEQQYIQQQYAQQQLQAQYQQPQYQPQMQPGFQPQTHPRPSQEPQGLVCKKCGSSNVIVQIMQDSQKTSRKGVGFGGHMNNAARGMTAVATLGMSNLFWKKSEGVNKTKINNKPVAVCQTCGYMWDA